MTEPHTECAICSVAFKDHGSVQHGFLHPAPAVDDSLRETISEAGFKEVLSTSGATVSEVAKKEAESNQSETPANAASVLAAASARLDQTVTRVEIAVSAFGDMLKSFLTGTPKTETATQVDTPPEQPTTGTGESSEQ